MTKEVGEGGRGKVSYANKFSTVSSVTKQFRPSHTVRLICYMTEMQKMYKCHECEA